MSRIHIYQSHKNLHGFLRLLIKDNMYIYTIILVVRILIEDESD